MSDDLADPVQPEAGQGGEGMSDAPYAEYLSRVPENVRGDIEPVFKDWDANVTRKFQEASQYRNQWQPYEQIGLNQHTPEQVQWALQVAQAAQENPQALREWIDQTHGPTAPPEPQQPPQPTYDEFGQFQQPDPGAQLEQILSQKLSPLEQRLEQFAQWQQNQEEQAALAEAHRQISSQIDELKTAHQDVFADKSDWGPEKMLDRFIGPYIESDPQNAVRRGFDDYVAQRGWIEKQVLESKANTPPPPEGGGTPNTGVEQPRTLQDARGRVMDIIREANRQGM